MRFSDISTRNELADFLQISRKSLAYILYKNGIDAYYSSFDIPKKSGGFRQINAPKHHLKFAQKRLSFALWNHQNTMRKEHNIKGNISHAFEKKKSIITNAEVHKNKKFVLNIDLTNFFGSFHFGRVVGFFSKNHDFKLPIEVATVIAQLACYNGCLPQGAPSSPVITNLIGQILDMRLIKLCKKYKLCYTRYADDLTFSTNNKPFINKYTDFYNHLLQEISQLGFAINDKKTRFQLSNSRQEVTGLVVNEKVSVNRDYCKDTRAMAHSFYTKGEFHISGSKGNVRQLEGRFSFIDCIDKYNNSKEKRQKKSTTLNGREREYRKFLFYKYFFFNGKPLIISEGKTDITYIKSALKNLHIHYPSLITKKTDGSFEYKIAFLNRSSKLKYFFDFSQDGADAMKNLYKFFSPSKADNAPDYISLFKKICNHSPRNPVIFIFDNEICIRNKPLYKFVNAIKASESQKHELITKLFIKLIDNANLYLLTNQLVGHRSECEIEDLFDEKTLSLELDGKTFSRESNFDTDKHFGKHKFAQHISKNYSSIDFSNFRPILDNLCNIIRSY